MPKQRTLRAGMLGRRETTVAVRPTGAIHTVHRVPLVTEATSLRRCRCPGAASCQGVDASSASRSCRGSHAGSTDQRPSNATALGKNWVCLRTAIMTRKPTFVVIRGAARRECLIARPLLPRRANVKINSSIRTPDFGLRTRPPVYKERAGRRCLDRSRHCLGHKSVLRNVQWNSQMPLTVDLFNEPGIFQRVLDGGGRPGLAD
jgi:hypothetical protein